jgi:ketosteroid isomerase-like protein
MSCRLGLWLVVIGCATLAGCGDDATPKPDREQVRALVEDFFGDAAADKAEAVCAALTPDGRARAVLRRFVGERPLRAASQARCVDEKAPWALDSTDLPYAMDHGYRVRVPSVQVRGTTAMATVRFTAFERTWRFRKADDGWKIDDFSLPVRE